MELTKVSIDSKQLSEVVAQGMLEKKGVDVIILDLRKVKSAVTDFFVICSGNSDTQVDAITDSVEQEVYKRLGQDPWHKEGKENREWILLDYVDVVVHVFKKDRRQFFALEDLWGDAEVIKVDAQGA
jgi:ribosome-associated protein